MTEFSHTNAAERVREDMASAITALDFLATSIGQLAALHEADEEEAIITEGRVIAVKRQMIAAVTGLLEAEPEKAMAYDFFCDTFSESFVPFYTYKKYESALAECDEEAKDELTRLNDEFERTDAYERQIEIFSHLNQLRTK